MRSATKPGGSASCLDARCHIWQVSSGPSVDQTPCQDGSTSRTATLCPLKGDPWTSRVEALRPARGCAAWGTLELRPQAQALCEPPDLSQGRSGRSPAGARLKARGPGIREPAPQGRVRSKAHKPMTGALSPGTQAWAPYSWRLVPPGDLGSGVRLKAAAKMSLEGVPSKEPVPGRSAAKSAPK